MRRMRRPKRKQPKRGRHLEPRLTSELIERFPDVKAEHLRLVVIGFRLKGIVCPYVRTDGRITIDFVWLKRRRNETTMIRHVMRVAPGKVKR